jgi:hypothetical protein
LEEGLGFDLGVRFEGEVREEEDGGAVAVAAGVVLEAEAMQRQGLLPPPLPTLRGHLILELLAGVGQVRHILQLLPSVLGEVV